MVYNKLAPTINPAISGNPSSFAMNKMSSNAAKQAQINQQYAGASTVPIVRAPYTSYSGAAQNTTSTQVNNFKTNQQAGENAKYDHYAYTGGRRRKTRRNRRRSKKTKRRRTTRTTRKCRKW